MCGIFCQLKYTASPACTMDCQGLDETIHMLINRGPDRTSSHTAVTPVANIVFNGHVLWQQGEHPSVQPIVRSGHVLLFNGDIYSKRGHCSASDTQWLFERIVECETEDDFIALFRTIEGPYSIVYLNPSTNVLYIMRDSLGRQSLLLGRSDSGLLISSVSSKSFENMVCIELPPLGIYKLDLNSTGVSLHPWQPMDVHELYHEQLAAVRTCLGTDIVVLEPINPLWYAIKRSGTVEWNFESVLAEDTALKTPSDVFSFLLNHPGISDTCDKLLDILSASVKDRCRATPSRCKNCIKDKSEPDCTHCRIGVLFSGGLDCTILAILADRFVDKRCQIDLLNVSFEKIRRNGAAKTISNENCVINYDTPDRVSARESLKELEKLCPNRTWNLIESNITRTELQSMLPNRISALLHPMDTVLDESLGAALWFAARGRDNDYTTPSRVLLVGSGADELFGGYTRHRNAFCRNNGSWEMLNAELELDWVRLPSRNLARDDRVIGDHGVTARSPYVEENVAHFVRGLDASQKCLHTLEQGVGDKLLLRLCAFRLGLDGVCWLRKRALQFGSRIADNKQNAKDKSNAL